MPFPSRDAGHPARKLVLFLFFCSVVLRLGCRDIPAQGLTPPLHPRKGHRPLTLFRWRVPWELVDGAVTIAGCGAARPETLVFFPFPLACLLSLGCRPYLRRG